MRQPIFKFLFLVFLCFCIAGCEPNIENNKRLLVSGQLLDTEGTPLPNILVSAKVGTYTLGQQRSNAAGKFQFASLESYDDALEIHVNEPYKDPDTTYTTFSYRNIATHGERDRNTYDLGAITLAEMVDFHLEIKKSSKEAKNLQVTFSLQDTHCQSTYQNSVEITDKSECHPIKTISAQLDTKNPAFDRTFKVIKGTEVHLEYQLNDQEKEQVNIPLTAQKNSYVLEY